MPYIWLAGLIYGGATDNLLFVFAWTLVYIGFTKVFGDLCDYIKSLEPWTNTIWITTVEYPKHTPSPEPEWHPGHEPHYDERRPWMRDD